MENQEKALEIMNERFGHDNVVSLATVENDIPFVRNVDGYYEDGSFYTITYALSNKIKQLEKNPTAAICGEWFTAHAIGENMGYIRDDKNKVIADKLRNAFASWYSNGHTNEDDPNTIILRIRLTDGILFAHGTRYDIDFKAIFSK